MDVSYAPKLGRLCALMEIIPADYQALLVKVHTLNELTVISLNNRLVYFHPEARLAETHFLLLNFGRPLPLVKSFSYIPVFGALELMTH